MDKKEAFIQKLKKEFPEQFESIVKAISFPFPITFRLCGDLSVYNQTIESLAHQGFICEEGPIKNSYILRSFPPTKRLSETQEFETGKIYIQKLSSMLPSIALDPKPTDAIIDLCAAPGSKTIQLWDMAHSSKLYAVENNRARFFRLKENLAKYNVEIANVFNADAALFPKNYPQFINFFDKVLLDAPCSNEGQIVLSNPLSYKHWNSKLPKKIAKLQKRLFTVGTQLLSSGGELLYSTCTFSKDENEDIVEWAVNKFSDLKLVESKRIFPDGKFTAFYYAKFKKNS